jgi:hypothetical protein
VAYAGHQVPEPGTVLGRELVSGVAEIAEVQTRHADRLDRVRQGRHLVEVASP